MISRRIRLNEKPLISIERDSLELAALYEKAGVEQFEHGKELIAALDICAGEHVLDVGTGTGRLAVYVAELVGRTGRIVGIDPLPLRVGIARSKSKENFEVRVGQAENLSDFRDGSFDVVYLNSVFHWIEDKSQALAEF